MSTHVVATPVINLGWPGRNYGQAAGTVFAHSGNDPVNGRATDVLCAFDPVEIAWSRCYPAPDDFPALKHDMFDAIVGDPINNRLVLIGGMFNTFSSSPSGIQDVWAIDLETAEWTEAVGATDAPAAMTQD